MCRRRYDISIDRFRKLGFTIKDAGALPALSEDLKALAVGCWA